MIGLFLILTIGISVPQRIVYPIGQGDKANLFVINLDGTGKRQITHGPTDDSDPVWSPDGTKIAFIRVTPPKSKTGTSQGNIWIVNPDGTGLKQLTSGPHFDDELQWNRDSKGLTISRQGSMYGCYRLDLNGRLIPVAGSRHFQYRLAPKGDLIAYARPESDEDDDHRYDIWITNRPSKPGKRLTNYKTSMYSPVWSPDAKGFVFIVEQPEGKSIQWLSSNGKSRKTLLRVKNTYFEDPVWSPDGKRIAFLESRSNLEPMQNASFRQLYVMNADGSNRKRLTNHWGDDYSPQWTRDGKAILVTGRRGTGSYLVLVDANGMGEQQITDISSNSGVLSP